MDTQTRHALKKDKFAQAAADSASWVSGHRSGVLRWVIVGVVAVVAIVGSLVVWNQRSAAAEVALNMPDTFVVPGIVSPDGGPKEDPLDIAEHKEIGRRVGVLDHPECIFTFLDAALQ